MSKKFGSNHGETSAEFFSGGNITILLLTIQCK